MLGYLHQNETRWDISTFPVRNFRTKCDDHTLLTYRTIATCTGIGLLAQKGLDYENAVRMFPVPLVQYLAPNAGGANKKNDKPAVPSQNSFRKNWEKG